MRVTPLQLEVLRQADEADRPMHARSFSFRGVPVPHSVVDRMVARGLLSRESWTPGSGPKPVSVSALGRAALAAGDDPLGVVPLAPSGPLAAFTAHPTLEFDPERDVVD